MIIGICGLIGAGKDTIANHLVAKYSYERYSWATPLKDISATLFGWDRDMLEGATPELRAQRELRDEWWSDKLGKEWTPRYALQYMGTEVMRGALHPDIWVLAGQRRIAGKDNVVIPDTRFPNEIRAIRELKGRIIRVKRGEDPMWYSNLSFFKAGMPGEREVHEFMTENYPEVHASEYSWHGSKFDIVIENDGTIEDLQAKLDSIISDEPRLVGRNDRNLSHAIGAISP